MAGARKKPAKKASPKKASPKKASPKKASPKKASPPRATMSQGRAGTHEEYRRRSAALAKRHGWNESERKRWEALQRRTDKQRYDMSRHGDTTARASRMKKRVDAQEREFQKKKRAGKHWTEIENPTYPEIKERRRDAESERKRGARQRSLWRTGNSSRESIYDTEERAVGKKVSPTEAVRRDALRRQKAEADTKSYYRKKAVGAAKKAASKRSPAKKRAAPLKRRSYR